METDSIQTSLLDGLAAELHKMRRNVGDFAISGVLLCKFCSKPKTAYQLINAKFGDRIVGSWCSTHGWLFFDSVALPPTERLRQAEVEAISLTKQRREDAARRKAAQ